MYKKNWPLSAIKVYLKNVKSQFVNGDLHVVRLISWIVLCCYVIWMQNLIKFLKNTPPQKVLFSDSMSSSSSVEVCLQGSWFQMAFCQPRASSLFEDIAWSYGALSEQMMRLMLDGLHKSNLKAYKRNLLLPFPSSGDLPDSGIEPVLLCLLHWQMDSLSLVPPGKSPDSWWDALFPLAVRGVLMKNSGKHWVLNCL